MLIEISTNNSNLRIENICLYNIGVHSQDMLVDFNITIQDEELSHVSFSKGDGDYLKDNNIYNNRYNHKTGKATRRSNENKWESRYDRWVYRLDDIVEQRDNKLTDILDELV
jgi:hypothetical protein